MPRTATRLSAPQTTKGLPRRTASAVASAVVLGSAFTAPAARSAELPPAGTHTLPAGDAALLDAGRAGWTAAFGVTATGCAGAPCPTLTSEWRPDAGPRGAGDGALAIALSGVGAHAGVATATLRSPVFLAPPTAGDGAFHAGVRVVRAAALAAAVPATISVRVVDAVTGQARTIVEPEPIGASGGRWTDVDSDTLGSGALTPSGAYRLELVVRFLLAGDDAADTTVLIDRPALAMQAAATPATTARPAPGIGDTSARPSDSLPASADEVAPADDARDACLDPVTILGAAAIGRAVQVTGVADMPAGARIDLLTDDGWRLGSTAVAPGGAFDATVRPPRGAARTRVVLARSADGEASREVRVQRRHVLRPIRPAGNGLVVEGRVEPSWLRGARRGHLALSVPEHGRCGALHEVQVGAVRVDPRSGRYRTTLVDGSAAHQEVRQAEVVSARLTRPDGAGAQQRAVSPLTRGPQSATQDPGP